MTHTAFRLFDAALLRPALIDAFKKHGARRNADQNENSFVWKSKKRRL